MIYYSTSVLGSVFLALRNCQCVTIDLSVASSDQSLWQSQGFLRKKPELFPALSKIPRSRRAAFDTAIKAKPASVSIRQFSIIVKNKVVYARSRDSFMFQGILSRY